jgi:hypothetical protein
MAQERPAIPTTFSGLMAMAREHVAALHSGHLAWGFNRIEHFEVDLDRGRIDWTLSDKMASAPAQLIGTWASDLDTYRWAWDHPAVPPELAPAAMSVREFALTHSIVELQNVEPACTREQGFDFASVAVLLGDLQGVYVGEASRTALAFIGFQGVTLSSLEQ